MEAVLSQSWCGSPDPSRITAPTIGRRDAETPRRPAPRVATRGQSRAPHGASRGGVAGQKII
jgi:hypothetical protein